MISGYLLTLLLFWRNSLQKSEWKNSRQFVNTPLWWQALSIPSFSIFNKHAIYGCNWCNYADDCETKDKYNYIRKVFSSLLSLSLSKNIIVILVWKSLSFQFHIQIGLKLARIVMLWFTVYGSTLFAYNSLYIRRTNERMST